MVGCCFPLSSTAFCLLPLCRTDSHSSSDAVTRVRYQHMRQKWLNHCYKAAELGTVAQAREWAGDCVERLVCPSYFCRFLGLSQCSALSRSRAPVLACAPQRILTSLKALSRHALGSSSMRHRTGLLSPQSYWATRMWCSRSGASRYVFGGATAPSGHGLRRASCSRCLSSSYCALRSSASYWFRSFRSFLCCGFPCCARPDFCLRSFRIWSCGIGF
jgi:hypothetical protein